jgi:hypothetical protein
MGRFGTLGALAVLGFGLSAAVSRADEAKIPLSEVPKAVTKAFKAKFPEATIKNAIKEEEGGKVSFEIESTLKNGLTLDAVLKPDGEFVAIEKEIKPSALPSPVAPEVETRYPKAVIQKAEAVESGSKITYEAVIKKADGKTATLIFDKDGKFVEVEK